jgi:hypothetical protein
MFLKEQKAPSQLNHSAAYSCVARLGEPFLSRRLLSLSSNQHSALRLVDPKFPQEDLVHQHVRCFYINTNNAGDQSDHRVRSITGRLLHTLKRAFSIWRI